MCLSEISSVRTDFGGKNSFQKVVRFNFDGSLMVTGGSDGIVRLWKVCEFILLLHDIILLLYFILYCCDISIPINNIKSFMGMEKK